MRSVRLILAGANSKGSVEPAVTIASTAVARLGLLLGGRARTLVGKPVLQLVLDLHQFFGVGLERGGMRPLEPGFELAPDFPIGIAEMIVDGRVLGPDFDRALEMLHGLVVFPDPVIGPAERVD